MRRSKIANNDIMHAVDINELVERSKCRKTGKVRFTSKVKATFFIYWLKWKQKKQREKGKSFSKTGRPEQRRTYHCKACQGFHLTKESRNSYEQRRRKEKYKVNVD